MINYVLGYDVVPRFMLFRAGVESLWIMMG